MSIEKFDVAVIGAGPAGICAAIQAAKAGCSTLLVEKNGIAGGTLTVGGICFPGIFHAWDKQVIAGIGWDLVEKTRQETGDPIPDLTQEYRAHWRRQLWVNPVIFAGLCDEAFQEAGVDIRFHTMLGAVEIRPEDVKLTLCGKDGLYDCAAKRVIDCTGDANALKIAGAELVTPESCQPGTFSVYAFGYDTDKLDWDALEAAFDKEVAAGRLSAEDMGWAKKFNRNFFYGEGHNSNHITGINAADSKGRTEMEIAGRASLMRMFRFFRTQPGLEKLEFKFSCTECGVRETRTFVGRKTVTADDYAGGKHWDDAICYAFYPIDLHDHKLGLDKRELKPGIVPMVPIGALIPVNTPHFLGAGRIISSDRLANSALRVQATCFATGQAAGALAALSVKKNVEPEAIPMKDVRELLEANGAIVP